MSDWDRIPPERQAAITRSRKLSGHTSVAEHERLKREAAADAARAEGELGGVCRAIDELRALAIEAREAGRLGGMFDTAADRLEARLFVKRA